MGLLDELTAKISGLRPDDKAALVKDLAKLPPWVPNPGAQTDGYFSSADVLLYGGQGGGGKSELLLGLALTAHRNSLIMRRTYPNLAGLTRRIAEIAGRKGLKESPPPKYQTDDGRLVEFGAAQHAGDEQNWQGQPHDLLGFDEATQFLESQVRFLMGWVRSADPKQRKRTVLATNPPLDATGDWVIKMFRPWLDITYVNPAAHGELRWFITDHDGNDLEVDGPRPVERDGRMFIPTSRTFIPAALADNPFLISTGYQAQLDALPEPVRSAVRDGNFMAARQDAEWQVIPTQWVIEAQSRWKPDGWRQMPMTCMALDPAGGGADSAELARRHGVWYAEMISTTGPETADGSLMAAKVAQHRRNSCPVVVDVGGGYAGGVIVRMDDNAIPYSRFDGGAGSDMKTHDGARLAFANKRAEAWWRMREELDPTKDGGSQIALPPDPELIADLTAPTWKLTARGILVESKEEIRKRLGRSTNKGDAVVMACGPGNMVAQRYAGRGREPRVIQSREAARRRR